MNTTPNNIKRTLKITLREITRRYFAMKKEYNYEEMKIYYRLLKIHPEWSKKRAWLVAHYAYQAKYGKVQLETAPAYETEN